MRGRGWFWALGSGAPGGFVAGWVSVGLGAGWWVGFAAVSVGDCLGRPVFWLWLSRFIVVSLSFSLVFIRSFSFSNLPIL